MKQNVILFPNVVYHKYNFLYIKLTQYNEHVIITVDTDGRVLCHQCINSRTAEYARMRF